VRCALSASWRVAVILSLGILTTRCGGSSSDQEGTGASTSSACTPGASIACTGPSGCSGFQVCKPDGGGYQRCDCMPTATGPAAGSGDATTFQTGDGGNPGGGDATRDTGDAAGGADTAGSPASGPVAVSLGSQPGAETETQLAIAPDGTIAIAWIGIDATGASWIGYRFSTDGGTTFSPMARMAMPTGLEGSDPALTVDAAGNFYLSALGVHFAGTSADYTLVYVAKAMSGTTTFGVPVQVVNPPQPLLYDHPKILVTAQGTVVLGFAETTALADGGVADTSIGRIATSKDGQSWQLGTIVAPPAIQFANLFWFCEGPGVLYATYLEATATAEYIALRSSSNDGATWSLSSTIVSTSSEIVAGLDPGCVAQGSDVWVVYTTTSAPTTDPVHFLDSAKAIRVAHSGDRGSTVDPTPMDALDTAASSLGLMPVLVRETGGGLDVAYLAGNSEGDTRGSMRYVRDATDAGFGSSVAVDGPLTFTMNRTMGNWLGDYLGAVASGNKLLIAYPNNASGNTHIYFRAMPLQ
jgi:hypothetical protein